MMNNLKAEPKIITMKNFEESMRLLLINRSSNVPLKPIPLKNKNFNCYMNSAIQAVLSLFVDLSQFPFEIPKECHAFWLMKGFVDCFETRTSFSIYDFIKENCSLDYISPEFTWNRQEDAHEFLSHTLNRLEEEINIFEPFHKFPCGVSYDSRLFCDTCHHSNISTPNLLDQKIVIASVNDNFGGMITDSIQNRIDEYNCEYCHKKTKASSSDIFTDISEYFIVCFKRFTYDDFGRSTKDNKEMIINDQLDIPFGDKDNKQKQTYELISIVNHIGSVSHGHYYSFVKYEDQWYMANDETISLVNFYQVKSSSKNTNYIHVYKKR